MSETVLHLVEHFGYVVIAALIFAEGVGLPLPGEASLIVGAALAANTGRLTLAGVVLAAFAGAVGGAAGGYWIGASMSDARLQRWAARFGIGPAHFARAQAIFRAHGIRTAVLGRFVTLLRMMVALLAGASRMRFGVFIAASALGAAIWAGAFGALGFAFGDRLPWLEHVVGRTTLIVTLALVFGASLVVLARRRRENA